MTGAASTTTAITIAEAIGTRRIAMIARARTKWPPIFTSRRTGPGHPAGHINGKRGERMNAPLIERRELAPRLEAQVRAVSAEPGAPMRLTRYFRLTERGLGELVAHAARLDAGALGKGAAGPLGVLK
jgi:hypothetical protein